MHPPMAAMPGAMIAPTRPPARVARAGRITARPSATPRRYLKYPNGNRTAPTGVPKCLAIHQWSFGFQYPKYSEPVEPLRPM